MRTPFSTIMKQMRGRYGAGGGSRLSAWPGAQRPRPGPVGWRHGPRHALRQVAPGERDVDGPARGRRSRENPRAKGQGRREATEPDAGARHLDAAAPDLAAEATAGLARTPDQVGARPRRGLTAWQPFRHRSFTLLWGAGLVSTVGSWMQTVAVG